MVSGRFSFRFGLYARLRIPDAIPDRNLIIRRFISVNTRNLNARAIWRTHDTHQPPHVATRVTPVSPPAPHGAGRTARETPLSPVPRTSLSASPARPAIHDRRVRPGPPLPPAPLSSRAGLGVWLASALDLSRLGRRPVTRTRTSRVTMRHAMPRARGAATKPQVASDTRRGGVAAWQSSVGSARLRSATNHVTTTSRSVRCTSAGSEPTAV